MFCMLIRPVGQELRLESKARTSLICTVSSLLHSLVNGQLDCFHVLVIVNRTAEERIKMWYIYNGILLSHLKRMLYCHL